MLTENINVLYMYVYMLIANAENFCSTDEMLNALMIKSLKCTF